MTPCTTDSHDRLKRDTAQWQRLDYVGEQPAYDDERPSLRLEMRNCTACSSTLCREVEVAS